MTDTPHIDDRRRFKELWKELVFARVLAGILAGACLIFLDSFAPYALAWPVAFALPIAAAKRGKLPFFAAAVAMIVASSLARVGAYYTVRGLDPSRMFMIEGAVAMAALGVVEGSLERSIAPIYAGMLGGCLIGALVVDVTWVEAFVMLKVLPRPITTGAAVLSHRAILIATVPAGHLGIGLSLALGRWIRDLPTRNAGVDPGAGER